jgi:hypothetical protein
VALQEACRQDGRTGKLHLYLRDPAVRGAVYSAWLDKQLGQAREALEAFETVVKAAKQDKIAEQLRRKLAEYRERFAECLSARRNADRADTAKLAEVESRLARLRARLTSRSTLWDARLESILSEI